MSRMADARRPDPCPFLQPVIADQLWVYSLGAYCRRPDAPVRAPAAATIELTCTTSAHRGCPGYRASSQDEPVGAE